MSQHMQQEWFSRVYLHVSGLLGQDLYVTALWEALASQKRFSVVKYIVSSPCRMECLTVSRSQGAWT